MTKRFLDCSASDFISMNKKQILESIEASEGRILVSEVIGAVQPLLGNISNAELASSFGADMLLLNMFDVNEPVFYGIPNVKKQEKIREIKRLTGRLVGINLEPVDKNISTMGEIGSISPGRLATLENAKKAAEMGASMILLTGNPGTGVSNGAVVSSLKDISKVLGDTIILAAGKMHAAGSLNEKGDNIISKLEIKEFVESGCDIVLLPAPGTVPGITMEYVRDMVKYSHSLGALTMTSIGTSQEGSDVDTIKSIALMCKMAGTDMHHIGDAGYPGIAIPENIMSYSIAIKGKRHTYSRMARSIAR